MKGGKDERTQGQWRVLRPFDFSSLLTDQQTMYTGQFGIALGGKGVLPRVPLWALILAAFGPDLVNTVLKLVGVKGPLETWSESAAGVLIVAALIAVLYWVLRQRDGRGALLVGVVAVLHLPADLAANGLPLWPAWASLALLLVCQAMFSFGWRPW